MTKGYVNANEFIETMNIYPPYIKYEDVRDTVL